MARYAARRVLLAIPTLLLVSIAVFMLIRLLPGDAIDLMVSENGYAPDRETLEKELGLDGPLTRQYVEWVGDLLQGDLGESLWTGRSATEELRQIAPVSIELSVMAIVIAALVGIPIGVLAAIRQDSALDFVFRSLSIGALSIPGFWFATLVLVFPAIWWDWSPPLTYHELWEDPIANLRQFIIPAAILAAYSSATIMRMTRSMVLEVLRQDYIRTAWAKGLRERTVVSRHALRNAMIPIVTIVGLQIPATISGGVILEAIFGLPGIGRFVLETISQRDYPMLQMITLVLAVFVLVTNIVVDVAYAYLDPRTRSA